MKYILAILLVTSLVASAQVGHTNANLDGLNNAAANANINAAIATDPSATRTAAGITLSTTGGANKVPQFDGSGNLQTGPSTNSDTAFAGTGNIFIPDKQGIQFLRKDGTLSGQYIYGWDEHGGAPGTPELIIRSADRIALIPYGPMQFGANDSARNAAYAYFTSGEATSSDTLRQSKALAFQVSTWDGAASQSENVIIQAEPLSTSGGDNVLRLWNSAAIEGAFGGGVTADKGKVTSGTMIAEFAPAGLWTEGVAPTYDTLDDSSGTVTQTCSKYKTIQAAEVTITDNRTLAFSGLLAGMRGVIYVTQDATGSRTLTPSGGSALDLTTGTGSVTDRVTWEFDGVYVNFAVQKNVQREVVVSDSDALAFITSASITDNTQKIAIDTLVQSLKTASLWTKFYALYPFVGGNAAAHAIDLKAAYNGTFGGTVDHTAHASGTIDTVAADGYFDSNFNFSAVGALNSASVYVYCRTQTITAGTYIFGTTTPSTLQRFSFNSNGANAQVQGPNSNTANTIAIGASSDYRKHIAVNRSSSTDVQAYINAGTASATNTSTTAVTSDMYFMALNGTSGAASYSRCNLGFAAIGQSLTSTEWETFRSIIDTFQTALGRANP